MALRPWLFLVRRALHPCVMHSPYGPESAAHLVPHRNMVLRPWFLQLARCTRLRRPCASAREEVGRNRPHAVVAIGCTLHMSWSPCVHAWVSSVWPRHAQSRVMVPPWCGQGLPLVPFWLTYPLPLKEQYMPFSKMVGKDITRAWGDKIKYLNNYKLYSKINLTFHLH